MSTRPLFVHIGSAKTGTSALQLSLWKSTSELAAAGVAVPLVGRQPHVRQILHPLGWVPGSAFVGPVNRKSLAKLGATLRATGGDRVLLSNEDLAEAESAQVEAFLGVVRSAGFDVHIVITARDWARQLPSWWQQCLKRRLTTEYEVFLGQVRDRTGVEAERFRRCQDVLTLSRRWDLDRDPSRVHVVAVPPTAVEPDAVYRLFGAAVGFDPTFLRAPKHDVNASFGYTEAEMLRRMNIVLGDRLPDFVGEFRPAMRRLLIDHVLARGASARIPLPPEHVAWVRAAAEEQLAGIVAAGVTIHGDPRVLVPAPDVGRPLPVVDADEIGEAALRTLVDFAIAQFEETRDAREAASSGRG